MYSLRAGILYQNTVFNRGPATHNHRYQPTSYTTRPTCPPAPAGSTPNGSVRGTARFLPLPAAWNGLARPVTCSVSVVVGAVVSVDIGMGSRVFATLRPTYRYVCIHEYVVFTVVFSGGRDTVLIHRIRSPCAGIHMLQL